MSKTARRTLALCTFTAVLGAGLLLAPSAFAEEGGVKDTSGLIWSESQRYALQASITWTYASNGAANYVVIENGITYDDWRLPTIAEVRAAITDGTIQTLTRYPDPTVPPHLVGALWSSKTQGNKAYVVSVDYLDLANCIVDVAGSGGSFLTTKTSWCDACYVRGRPAPKK